VVKVQGNAKALNVVLEKIAAADAAAEAKAKADAAAAAAESDFNNPLLFKMKKWMYVIFPSVMLGVFLFFYFAEAKQAEIREKQRAAELAKQKAEDAEKKRVAEEKARLDSAKRQAERAAEDAKREADKLAKWQAEGKRIQDDTDKSIADADRFSKQVSELEIQLDAAKKAKDKASRESFDLLKLVERSKVERRNAEVEIQRLTEDGGTACYRQLNDQGARGACSGDALKILCKSPEASRLRAFFDPTPILRRTDESETHGKVLKIEGA